MKSAIYLRQSLDVAEGIERQRFRTRQLVDSRGWDFVDEYVDNDTSASKARGATTGWGRLLEDLARNRIEAVVAVDLDRLLRSTRDLNTLIDLGAKVVTVDGEIDLSTADGEFRATMLAGIARFESRRKGERQRRANEHRARAGKRPGGNRRQFGYALRCREDCKRDHVHERMLQTGDVVESEAAAIRDGYRRFLSGVPLGAIAREWNLSGIATTQARNVRSGHAGEPSAWTGGTVRQVLMNARNAGIVTYHGEEMGRAEWEPIVEESTYRAAAAILSDPQRRTAGTYGKYLLTGIAKCGIEGCGAHVYAGGAARPGIRAYRCSGSMGHFARKAEPVEEYVAERVIARLSRPDARELLLATPTDDTALLRDEALAVDAKLDALAVELADDGLTLGQFRTATDRLRERRAQIEAKIADAGRVDVLGPLLAADDAAEAWGVLDMDRRRAVVDLLMEVTVYAVGRGTRTFRPETVGIEWKVS